LSIPSGIGRFTHRRGLARLPSRRHSSRRVLCTLSLVMAALLGLPAPAHAQLGFVLGSDHGFGGFARVGPQAVKIELAGGLRPVLSIVQNTLIVNGTTVVDEVSIKLYTPYQAGARLSLRLGGSAEAHKRLGLRFGASYNELLKHGFGGGFDFQTSRRISFAFGLMVFPEASEELRNKFYDEQLADDLKPFIAREDITISPLLTDYQLAFGFSVSLF
jgi:hypothetical protein